MVVHMVLRRPVPAPAPQVRVIWQGIQSGDAPEARWTDGSGQRHSWSGTRGVPWLLRDELRQGEEWKVNLRGIPADVGAVSLVMSASVERTIGVLVQPLSGDPNSGVLHPGVTLVPGATAELLVLHRAGDTWQVVALNDDPASPPAPAPQAQVPPPTSVPSPAVPPTAPTAPPVDPRPTGPAGGTGPASGPAPGWGAPVTDAPGPPHPADRTAPPAAAPAARPAGPPPATPWPAPTVPDVPAPAVAPAAAGGWTDHSAPQHTVDQGPQVPIPERLSGAVDAARATGLVRRARVSAIVDLSASMHRWIASGAVADILTATQAVAGAAQRPALATRFLPDGAEVALDLQTEPAAALRDHLRVAGLRTGDRRRLMAALAQSSAGGEDGDGGRASVTVVITDDPSLSDAVGPGTAAVIVGAAGETGAGAGAAERAVAVAGPVDVPRLARDLAQRCFMPTRR